MRNRLFAGLAVAALLTASAGAATAGSWEATGVVGQGLSGASVAGARAAIKRTSTSVIAHHTMPTPTPGSYNYPGGATASGVAGHPEVYSLWVFVFFNPEACASTICGPGDLMNNTAIVAGAFNGGGHVAGGPTLQLSGSVNQFSPTFGGPNAETIGQALAMGYDLAGAEIHLAVAPHGALDPKLLPASIQTPAGNPTFWWISLFGLVS